MTEIALSVNGTARTSDVEPRLLLVQYMGATPMRASGVEHAIASGALVADAAAAAADGTEPVAGFNASVEYRRHLARVLVRRGLELACAES